MRSRPRSFRFAHVLVIGLALVCASLGPRAAFAADPEEPAEQASSEQASAERTLTLGPGSLPPVSYPKTALRVGAVDALFGGMGATVAIFALVTGANTQGPQGANPFDEAVRNALLPDSYDVQLLFRDTSDALLGASISFAFIGDALIHATWLRKSPEVGVQMALIDAEVMLLSLGTAQLTATSVGRQRPYGRTCGVEIDEDSAQCVEKDRYLSFFSTHSTLAFSMAAVTCAHHHALGLSGRYPWIACATGFTAAAATAVSRIVADQHYATDVLTGAAVGTVIGFAVPAFHYGIGRWRPRAVTEGSHVFVLPTFGGVAVTGVW